MHGFDYLKSIHLSIIFIFVNTFGLTNKTKTKVNLKIDCVLFF